MKGNRSHNSPKKGMKIKNEEILFVCMKAPSAEHARAHDYDEPCDDGRTGEIENNPYA